MADNELKAELAAMKEDLSRLQEDLRSFAGTLVDQGKEKAVAAGETISDNVEAGLSSARDYVEERPLTMMLVALGVGVLLGRITAK